MRVAVRTSPGRILLLDPGEIHYIKSDGDGTLVRNAPEARSLG